MKSAFLSGLKDIPARPMKGISHFNWISMTCNDKIHRIY